MVALFSRQSASNLLRWDLYVKTYRFISEMIIIKKSSISRSLGGAMKGKCPKEIGGADVIAYAVVKTENLHKGNTKQIVAGRIMGVATAMIIAQYEGDSAYYVFGCYSDEWATETDTWHEDLEDAIEQLDWEYENLSKNIVWYVKPQ